MTVRSRLHAVDRRLYTALAAPVGEPFDTSLSRFTNAADNSRLSMVTAATLAIVGGRRGRRSALMGLACVGATSAVTNLIVKPVARRRRPDRKESHHAHPPGGAGYVPMPSSASFPSGHWAAAVACAVGVWSVWPAAGIPVAGLAGVVGYSRVHAGVHYPGDVLAGFALGGVVAVVVETSLSRVIPVGTAPN